MTVKKPIELIFRTIQYLVDHIPTEKSYIGHARGVGNVTLNGFLFFYTFIKELYIDIY